MLVAVSNWVGGEGTVGLYQALAAACACLKGDFFRFAATAADLHGSRSATSLYAKSLSFVIPMLEGTMKLVPTLLLVLTCLACDSAPTRHASTFRSDTLASRTVLITNDGQGAWTPSESWTATEDLRIGALQGGGPEQFGRISDIAVGDTGQIFVGDLLAGEIRVFRENGSYSHSFGAPGEGPGEFRRLIGIRVSPDGMVWIRDGALHRFSVFKQDGALEAVYPMEYRGYLIPWEAGFDSQGRLLDWETPLPAQGGGSADAAHYPFVPVRLATDFESFERLLPVVEHPRMLSNLPAARPYDGPLEVHFDHLENIWFADSDEYRVFRRDLSGDTTLIFTLPAEAQDVTEEEKDRAVGNWLPGQKIDRDQVLSHKPVLLRFTTSPDGHFLAFPRLKDVEEGTVMDVFNFEGHFLGRVPLPTKLELSPPPVEKRGFLYGVSKDEFDVPYVVRLRLAKHEG